MEPIDKLETKENFVANMKFEPDLAERIIQLSIANGYFQDKDFVLQLIETHPDLDIIQQILELSDELLNKEFALQLIKANPDCYKVSIDKWEKLKEIREVSLFAVQKDKYNLSYIPDKFNNSPFLIDAFGHNVSLLNEFLPIWKTRPMLIRRVYELNPDILDEISPTIYNQVDYVNVAFPTWKADLKLIKHILVLNPALFNELDPSMYDNPELFEFIRQEKIPLAILNKGIPQQEQFKERMRDLVSLALTQRRPWNIGTMGYNEGLTMQRNLGGPTHRRRGTIGGKRRRKTKRRTYGSAPPL